MDESIFKAFNTEGLSELFPTPAQPANPTPPPADDIGEIFKASYYPEYVKLLEICAKYGGRVCMFRNHSKVMVLLGDRFSAVIEASANVNTNPRSEQTCITVDYELALWYKGIFDKVRSFERIFDNVMPYAEKESKPL